MPLAKMKTLVLVVSYLTKASMNDWVVLNSKETNLKASKVVKEPPT